MTHDPRGLDFILVNKKKLLDTLRENRDAHRERFEEAMEGYKIRAIELLEDHIDRIKANAPEQVLIKLPMPLDHTTEYDSVIGRLEWSLDQEIGLDEYEFNRFVRNQWEWMPKFTETYAAYTGAATEL